MPGVTFAGSFIVGIDTRVATKKIAVDGIDVELGVMGQTLQRRLHVRQERDDGLDHAHGRRRSRSATARQTLVTVTVASGSITIFNDGIVAAINNATLTLAPSLSQDFPSAATSRWRSARGRRTAT